VKVSTIVLSNFQQTLLQVVSTQISSPEPQALDFALSFIILELLLVYTG